MADRLQEAQHEARREAAPFLLAVALAQCGLAALSAAQSWQLLWHDDWWVWLVLAAPSFVLAVAFLGGLGQVRDASLRRRVAIALLVVLAGANLAGVGLLVASLVAASSSPPTGAQLLVSALVVLLTNVVTFALAFWELDCGGPVRRAFADARRGPDFQFPQDENAELARPGWAPLLPDYVYLSLTNSIAFSPTDVMPLTRRAKLLMGAESVVSILTVLVVAARAVNILGSA